MGAMINYENQMATQNTHMACVYCATYGALKEFLQYDWCGVLQLLVPVWQLAPIAFWNPCKL